METATWTLQKQKQPSIQAASQVAFDFCQNCIYYQCVNSELFSIKLFLPLPHSAPPCPGLFSQQLCGAEQPPSEAPCYLRKLEQAFHSSGSLTLLGLVCRNTNTLPCLKGFPKTEKTLKYSNAENEGNRTTANLDLTFFCLKYQHYFTLQHVLYMESYLCLWNDFTVLSFFLFSYHVYPTCRNTSGILGFSVTVATQATKYK